MKFFDGLLYPFVIFISITDWASALDNGLALTPPMGWLSWQRYRCVIDCETYPDECISEKLFKKVADLFVSKGYKDVGYNYVIIDDCWLERDRTPDGKLQADKKRFPNGIKHLADYVHSKGLKFGIYEDYGKKTCAGYPGVLRHMEEDAKLFAEWGVDYVKLDGCYSDVQTMDKGYPEFGKYLNATGRPMIYSCEWPLYQESQGLKIDFPSIAKYCNSWRNWVDIQDSYSSFTQITDYFALKQDYWQQFAGPGHWNDPDMLLIGNYGLSYDQAKAQMAIWAVLAAPLLMSTDLEKIKPEFQEILQNKEIIAVNQDRLGIQGRRVLKIDGIEVWTKPIEPKIGDNYSYAIAYVSRRDDGCPYTYNISLSQLGLINKSGYRIFDLYAADGDVGKPLVLKPENFLAARINPSGVAMFKAQVLSRGEFLAYKVLSPLYGDTQSTHGKAQIK